MSALAFVCKSDSVEVLTDSLSINLENGRVSDLDSKQVFVGSSGVLALNGWAGPCDLFAELATDTCADFDGLMSRADELWSSVNSTMLDRFPDDKYRHDPFFYVAALAGWSRARGRAEAYMFDSLSGERGRHRITAFVMGGGAESMDETLAFIRRFHSEPEQFDARRDGIPVFESMRQSPALIDDRLHYTVGGSIQHSIVTAAGIQDAIIHTWARDRVGQLVELD